MWGQGGIKSSPFLFLAVAIRLTQLPRVFSPPPQLFDRVREDDPNFQRKIVPISSELTQPGLAISPQDAQRLASCVHVVFHCAATIRFDEPLK